MSQTSYSRNLTMAREGQLMIERSMCKLTNKIASAALKFGLILQRDGEKSIKPIAALPAADDDSIVATPIASAATAQVITPASFDGVIGEAEIVPAQRLMFTLNNHGDWDDTVMKVVYKDAGDREIVEDVVIPNGGNTILYTAGVASKLIRIELPAQTGTNGTMDIGTDPTYYELSRNSFPGPAVYDPAKESYAATTEVAQYQDVAVLERGEFAAVVEAAVTAGDPVYVRMVESGTDMRGQVRGTFAANFTLLPGARFKTTQATVNGLAIVELMEV
jgi:hypothetical protein